MGRMSPEVKKHMSNIKNYNRLISSFEDFSSPSKSNRLLKSVDLIQESIDAEYNWFFPESNIDVSSPNPMTMSQDFSSQLSARKKKVHEDSYFSLEKLSQVLNWVLNTRADEFMAKRHNNRKKHVYSLGEVLSTYPDIKERIDRLKPPPDKKEILIKKLEKDLASARLNI